MLVCPNTMDTRRCLQTLGFDSTLAVIPTWASLRRAYLRRLRSSHPDRGACNANEFMQVQEAYKQLCTVCTPGTPAECDSDDDEVDQASTGGHVQTVRLPLKPKTAQFAGQRFHLTGSFRVNGDVSSECGTRGQTLVRKFIRSSIKPTRSRVAPNIVCRIGPFSTSYSAHVTILRKERVGKARSTIEEAALDLKTLRSLALAAKIATSTANEVGEER